MLLPLDGNVTHGLSANGTLTNCDFSAWDLSFQFFFFQKTNRLAFLGGVHVWLKFERIIQIQNGLRQLGQW
jgi:hypothetical protein